MESDEPIRLPVVLWEVMVVHTLTYFVAGVAAFLLLDYQARFAEPPLSYLMRPTDDVMVHLGPLLQPLRGLLFGAVFWMFRPVVFRKPDGWLMAWLMLVIVGILSTFGPAPGSIEGLIYTRLPVAGQLLGLTEVVGQSFLLSLGTWYWVNHPEKRWLGRVFTVAFLLVIGLCVLGLLAGPEVGS